MEDLRTEYRGIPIIYNEGANTFQALIDGQPQLEDSSLRNLREKIDIFEKAQQRKDFKRFKVYIHNWRTGDRYIEGEVTSIEGATKHYWVSCGGQRSKESTVFMFNDSNAQKIKRLKEIAKEIDKLSTESYYVQNSLESLSAGAVPKEQAVK